MELAAITLEVAEMILHMAGACYTEGFINNEEWELCQELVKRYPLIGEKWFRDSLELEEAK